MRAKEFTPTLEAAYKGNIGAMEVFKFYSKAGPAQKEKLEKLLRSVRVINSMPWLTPEYKEELAQEYTGMGWDLIQKVADVVLHGLGTAAQAVPKRAARKSEPMKATAESVSQLDEFKASPSRLEAEASKINARVGMEFEVVVPYSLQDEDLEPQRDLGPDERVRGPDGIRDFFHGDYMTYREVDRAMARIEEHYVEFVDERVENEWADYGAEFAESWMSENYGNVNKLIAKALHIELDEVDEEAKEEFFKSFHRNEFDHLNDAFYNMYEHFRDQFYGEDHWDKFLDYHGLTYMSDIADVYSDFTWPHWDYGSSSNSTFEDLAELFQTAMGRDATWSDRYHGADRRDDAYAIEPDSSIDTNDSGQTGVEFVSPPMSLNEMLRDLEKFRSWATKQGFETNKSTGLHINVSLEDVDFSKLDHAKLVVLLGDEYVLNQFGRSYNSYASSVAKRIRDWANNPEGKAPERVPELLTQMKKKLDSEVARFVEMAFMRERYISIHPREGWVEFRSPGGDWLYANYDKIKATLLRFVVALDAACDPEKYRKEYLTKLYKLLTPAPTTDSSSAMINQMLAKFQAGELDKEMVKNMLARMRYDRDLKKRNKPQQPPTQA